MYRSILVPLDGSHMSESAIPGACELARRSGATVHLVHVHIRYVPAALDIEHISMIDERVDWNAKAYERTYLEGVRERSIAEWNIPITIATLNDDAEANVSQTVPERLAAYAHANAVDLIVMTTHGYGGLERAWIGSVSDALVRSSAIPVLLTRPNELSLPVTAPPLFRHILIPLDGSTLAEQILEQAHTLGDYTEADYTLLHIVETSASGQFSFPSVGQDVYTEHVRAQQMEMRSYLEQVAERLRAKNCTVETYVRVAKHVASAILEVAQEHKADLIAIATHGRSGLSRLLIGSVADKIVRASTLPVCIYRPQIA